MEQKITILIVAALVSMFLLGYGYYGFFAVKVRQAKTGEMSCPFGAGKGMFSTKSEVFEGGVEFSSCSYAFECLIAGAIALSLIVKMLLPSGKVGT